MGQQGRAGAPDVHLEGHTLPGIGAPEHQHVGVQLHIVLCLGHGEVCEGARVGVEAVPSAQQHRALRGQNVPDQRGIRPEGCMGKGALAEPPGGGTVGGVRGCIGREGAKCRVDIATVVMMQCCKPVCAVDALPTNSLCCCAACALVQVLCLKKKSNSGGGGGGGWRSGRVKSNCEKLRENCGEIAGKLRNCGKLRKIAVATDRPTDRPTNSHKRVQKSC